jgi:hypothetical protein
MIDGARVEASPGLVGTCPACAAATVAKCGEQRVWHWAHKGARVCDPWWEPETDWHRAWKNQFPNDWQEIVQHDTAGERHIADVRTPQGLVVEFQHSHLNPVERRARERFHGNLIWIVDGLRLKRDIGRFQNGLEYFQQTPFQGIFRMAFPEDCFPADWLDSDVPVLFDFEGHEIPEGREGTLWCLLPGRAEGSAVVMCLRRAQVVAWALEKPRLLEPHVTVAAVAESMREAARRSQMAAQNAALDRILYRQMAIRKRRGFRRF